jgi:hypothetical protein
MDPNTDWVAGQLAGGLDFDGSNDYVLIGQPAALNLTSSFTVAAWVKATDVTIDHQQILSKGYNGSVTQWDFKIAQTDGMVQFSTYTGTVQGVVSVGRLTNNTWTHLVGVYNGTTWFLYWNGAFDNSQAAVAPQASGKDVVMGGLHNNTAYNQLWKGVLDEVRIYNRALTEPDAAALHAYTGAPAKKRLFILSQRLRWWFGSAAVTRIWGGPSLWRYGARALLALEGH